VLLGWKEDMKVIRVLVDIEKDAAGVTSVVTNTLDGGRIKVPVVQSSTVVLLVLVVQRDRCLTKHGKLSCQSSIVICTTVLQR